MQSFPFSSRQNLEEILNWKAKFFSVVGKEILLKVVLQAISSYVMGLFLIPKSISGKLNSMIKNFWLGFKGDASKIHWLKWKKLETFKHMGGLGFRDMYNFNLALLSKQGWCILKNPNSLVSQIFAQKYILGGSFFHAKIGKRHSYVWRSLLATRELLKAGLIWRIRNERITKIQKDKWLPRPFANAKA